MQTRTRAVALVLVAALLGAVVAVVPGPGTAGTARADGPLAGRLKVVVVVGPTHGLTDSNLAAGEAIARLAEARGADVHRVFHPNATWARVVAEAQDANVLVYLGHGNGFPSPYLPTLMPDRVDGMGLNPVAGGSSSNVKYYGEALIASQIRLAPNALVLLNHLCYASGNSEPGKASPTRSVAIQRVDNFAAGFLAAGAGAVIALGHQDAGDILAGLWGAPQTLDQLFTTIGGIGKYEVRTDSVRTPGATLHLDPESSTGYYRSIAGALELLTTDVLAPGAGGGGSTPVPGQTPDPGTTPISAPVPTPTPDPGTGSGAAPRVGAPEPIAAAFSPNGDGVQDSYSVTARIDQVATWAIRVEQPGAATLMGWAGVGNLASGTWDGQTASGRAPDGTYRVAVQGTSASGLVGPATYGSVVVDTVPPVLASIVAGTATGSSPAVFTPNGDRVGDTISLAYSVSEASWLEMTIRDAVGTPVRTLETPVAAGKGTISWDGTASTGSVVPDGTYTATVTPRDLAGNRGGARSVSVRVLTALKSVSSAPAVFDPRDGDAYGATTTIGFSLTQPATVSWRVTDLAGRTVRTFVQGQPLAPGPYALAWDGTGSPGGAGAMVVLPEGRYLNVVTATTPQGALTARTSIYLMAFRVITSAATRSAGQPLTVTLVSAEPLKGAPLITVKQPGLKPYRVATKLVGTATYRVTFTVRRGGSAGTMTLVASGVDVGGGTQTTTAAIAVR